MSVFAKNLRILCKLYFVYFFNVLVLVYIIIASMCFGAGRYFAFKFYQLPNSTKYSYINLRLMALRTTICGNMHSCNSSKFLTKLFAAFNNVYRHET